MRILIDILHPAHVHFFKHFRTEMLYRGHEVLVTAREKDVAVELLEKLDIPHEVLSAQRSGRFGLVGEFVTRSRRLRSIARRFRPTVMTGIMGAVIAPLGRLMGIPTVVFYDTPYATRTNRYVYPLASYVCTPDSYGAPVRGNHVSYAGYQQLAHLHPNRFTPDLSKLSAFGLEPPYAFVRFVSWEASHDIGHSSLSAAEKRRLIETIQESIPVVLSAEGPLPLELAPLRLNGPVEDIHHVLAHAAVVVGDGGTMVSEAAVLGTPAVVITTLMGGVHDDQIEYGMLARFAPHDFEQALAATMNYMNEGPPAGAHHRMLDDKVDVTTWMVDFFENGGREWQ